MLVQHAGQQADEGDLGADASALILIISVTRRDWIHRRHCERQKGRARHTRNRGPEEGPETSILSRCKFMMKYTTERRIRHRDKIPAPAKRIAQAEGISPSAQTAPSRKNCFFQMGTLRLRVSMPKRQASKAAARCAEQTTIKTEVSPISSRPSR